jgi:hypothetical protein
MENKIVRCNKCGDECYWDTNRNGKRYLAVNVSQEYEFGRGGWKMPHYCKATPEEAAAYQAQLQNLKDQQAERDAQGVIDGEIVVGQTVKVRRGRKVPIGIIGIVFWVADEADHFDTWKIGIKTEAGDKHFLAINNVEFYFDGADELYESRVAAEKAQKKAYKESKKVLQDCDGEI